MKNSRQQTHEIGFFGQGSVDLVSGNLSIEAEDFAWGGARMPVTIKHLYNSAFSDKQYTANSEIGLNTADFSAMKLGHGFRLNLMQSIVKNADGNYVFLSEDGDEILLKPTENEGEYKSSEEDGELEYNEAERILKNGDSYLFDETGRLICITDENGNTNQITYVDGKLTKVTDGADREFTLRYDTDGCLLSVKAPDSTTVSYTYEENRLKSVSYPENKKVEFDYYDEKSFCVVLFENETAVYKIAYTIENNRLTQFAEFGYNGGEEQLGNITSIHYDLIANKTVFGTEDSSVATTYFFDKDGNVIREYSSDMVSIGNNILNHNFNGLNNWNVMTENDENCVIESLEDEQNAKFGKHHLHINTMNSQANTNGIYQSTGGLSNGEHTFSVYVKINSGFNGENDGIYLRLKSSEYGNIDGQSEKIRNTGGEYVRLAVSTYLYFSGYDAEIIADGSGDAQICNAQLELNPSPNDYNMITDSNCLFEFGEGKWQSNGAIHDDTVQHDVYGSIKFVGDATKPQNAHQTIEVKTAASTRETFKLSGWAKGTALPPHAEESDSPTYRLRAVINYTDGTKTQKPITADFNPYTSDWQYASVEFSKDAFKEVENLQVFCDYDYNSGTVYFDNIELIRTSIETDITEDDFAEEDENTTDSSDDSSADNGETENATEDATTDEFKELLDAFGNTLTETTFTDGEFGTIYRSFGYDEDGNNLVKETDARGNVTEYTVDGVTSRNEEITDRMGNKTAFTYDDLGRTSSVSSKNAEGDELANVSYKYDSFDNLTEIVRGDGLKYVLKYNAFHNLQSIGIDGKTDGDLITYTYKEVNGRLKGMTYANGDKMTATYNGIGQMIAEKWTDKGGNVIAYYKYAYDKDGNIVRSVDIYARKMYNYIYEDGRLTYACDSAIEINEYVFIISKTPISVIRYFYDKEDKLTQKRTLFADGKEQIVFYTTAENESQLVKTEVCGHSFVSTSKTDSFGRKEFDELQLGSGFVSRQFDYVNGKVTEEHKQNKMLKSTPTTQLVSEITFQDGRTIDYEYDAEERITKVTDSLEGVTEYSYDALGQLLTETKNGEVINSMLYDNYGNIIQKNGIDYAYNGVWKDHLSHFGGKQITYDAQGNPLDYLGHILFWEKGRQLRSFDNTTYTYNANGIRTSKTVDGIRHDFHLDGGKILREVWIDNVLETVFDNEESVCGIVYNQEPFYFVKNLQGDIIAITDRDGEVVARYTYDAWGKCTIDSSSKNANIAKINPFRYRSYYYDIETGLYYLQSRYYDAEVGRFLNSDDPMFLGATGNIASYNLFAYCENNPVNYKDPSGYGPAGTIIGAILGFGLGALLVPRVADLLKLRGWGRKVFIALGVAALTGLGAYVGNYVGEAIFAIYKAGGAFALKINKAIANGIAKIVGGSIKAASGNGWIIKIGKFTLRIMTSGGGRTNYFRLSHATKGALTILGKYSGDRGLTHIPITFSNIIKIINLILKLLKK